MIKVTVATDAHSFLATLGASLSVLVSCVAGIAFSVWHVVDRSGQGQETLAGCLVGTAGYTAENRKRVLAINKVGSIGPDAKTSTILTITTNTGLLS